MKKLFQLSLILSCTIALLLNSSCSDNDIFEEVTAHSTTFRIYESNEDFPEINSTSSRFVSEGAVITIWRHNDNNGYDVVKQLKTGLDGTVIYQHNDEIIFYSVEKRLPNTEKENVEKEIKKNLATLHLYDEKGNIVNVVRFQVEGIFTSQEDIDSHAIFNFGVDSTEYTPKIGALKFKDINGDGYIDIEDSISRAMVDTWVSDEEIVYITSSK